MVSPKTQAQAPVRSLDQRMEALKRANEIRVRRAQLKKDLKDGRAHIEVVLRDPSRGIYKRVVLRDNKVVGAVLYGDTADGSWYFDLLKKGADVAELRLRLMRADKPVSETWLYRWTAS